VGLVGVIMVGDGCLYGFPILALRKAGRGDQREGVVGVDGGHGGGFFWGWRLSWDGAMLLTFSRWTKGCLLISLAFFVGHHHQSKDAARPYESTEAGGCGADARRRVQSDERCRIADSGIA